MVRGDTNQGGGYNTFKTSDVNIGELNIKYFDGIILPHNTGTILSGTFEMEVVNKEGKVIHITDGRFDI